MRSFGPAAAEEAVAARGAAARRAAPEPTAPSGPDPAGARDAGAGGHAAGCAPRGAAHAGRDPAGEALSSRREGRGPPGAGLGSRPSRSLAERVINAGLDLKPFYELAVGHPVLGPLTRSLHGLKPFRPASLFDMLVTAVIEQQISLFRRPPDPGAGGRPVRRRGGG